MANYQAWLNGLSTLAPKIAYVVLLGFGVVGVVQLIRLYVRTLKTVQQPMTGLLLTPPARVNMPSSATDELFTAIHGLLQPTHLVDRLLGYQARMSLEIVSTKLEGIRFVIQVPRAQAAAIEQMIAGYLPETKVSQLPDPLQFGRLTPTYRRYKQKLHYAYPLRTADKLVENDPISYLTNAMTKLAPTELMALQLVIAPVVRAEVAKLAQQIRRNEDILPQLSRQPRLGAWRVARLSDLSLGLSDLLSETLAALTAGNHYAPANRATSTRQADASNSKPIRSLSSFEYELVASIDHKLAQPLFRAELRSIVVAGTKPAVRSRTQAVQAALSHTAVSKHQQLKSRRVITYPFRRLMTFYASRRLLGLRPALLLSTNELATLYHFPTSSNTKTDNLVTSLSRSLSAPVSLKGSATLDIIFGENDHHGQLTPIGLTAAERERHVYVVGGTGNGKTTMLLYAIVQDIKAGKGLTVVDPHGDLAETILRHIPAERMQDVIYLNPDDLARPIGINLLELPPGLAGDDLLREKDLITESVISVLRKIFSENDAGGHRIEYVLRNTIQTALTLEGATLFTIFRLLNNNKYRSSVVRTLEDEDLVSFWKNEIGKAGEYQKIKMSAGITAKIGRFLFSASARRMLEQEQSTIDFEDVINSGKILICNFSKGLLGEDTSTLFGTTILAKLQVAALRRARLDYIDRQPYYLYVDEFQNFATMSFVQMLSEARKYKLFLTMAEQSTAQQEQQRMVDIILANVGTTICFRTGSPADELRLLPLFRPYINDGELANLPTYNFYARIAALQSQEPMSGRTLLLNTSGSRAVRDAVIKMSREKYGLRPIEVNIPVLKILNSPQAAKQPAKKAGREKINESG